MNTPTQFFSTKAEHVKQVMAALNAANLPAVQRNQGISFSSLYPFHDIHVPISHAAKAKAIIQKVVA